ncbi:hypothetical protein [Ascidiimonas sp. W6]|uniref:hypothetical protein n=1 Tax=Ascidiimonas meishanensis TaxID=3128903 RepID=UPI0030EB6EEA
MKVKLLTLVVFLGITTILINGCAFLKGKGSTSNETSICMNYAKSEKPLLSLKLVHEMTQLYQSNPNIDDTKAIRFDLETLKNFIYHLEIEAKKNNIPSKDLGIRIYYSRYPKLSTWYDAFQRDLFGFTGNAITRQYEMRHTLVMIPTIHRDSINYDFNPLEPGTYSTGLQVARFLSSSEQDTLTSKKYTFALSVTQPVTNAQNHGDLYPPFGGAGLAF